MSSAVEARENAHSLVEGGSGKEIDEVFPGLVLLCIGPGGSSVLLDLSIKSDSRIECDGHVPD
jgi:hypothetical protein